MLMMSTEHQQLLPGEIINNQSPISQAFKSIKHIMDTRARQWSDLGLIEVLQTLLCGGIEHQNIFPVIWLKTMSFLNKVCAPWFMNSDRHSIVKMLVLTKWQPKFNHLLNAWSCVFLGHWIEQLSNWIVGTCIVFVCCGCGGGFSDVALGWMSSCTLYSDVALPLWVRICFIRLDHWIVEYSHHLHCFGFCKECVLMWYLRSCACEDAKSHCVQLCGFCPLWMSMCLFRLPARPKDSLHC